MRIQMIPQRNKDRCTTQLAQRQVYRSSPPPDTAEEESEAADRENLTNPLDQEKS
jgi:hypothetical protein